ncbi:hypothetical protein ACFLZP_03185, partial [Patescibacteria group bacterium]
NSLSFSLNLGQWLTKLKKSQITIRKFCQKGGFFPFGSGTIIKQEQTIEGGFCQGSCFIKTKAGKNLQVIYKNENLVLLRENRVLLTCPDLICLLDLDRGEGLCNFLKNQGKRVAVLGKKALPIWRQKKGQILFSPQNLGLNFKQKLL